MGRKLTQEEFLKKLYENNTRYRDGEFSIASEYSAAKKKIKCKCNKHGDFYAYPDNLLRANGGCQICSRGLTAQKNALNHEQFLKKVEAKNKYVKNNVISIYGEYKNSHSVFKCKCNKCGCEWEVKASYLINGHVKCKVCNDNTILTTHEQFIKKLINNSERYANGEYSIVSEYTLATNKIDCKCNKCGLIFSVPAYRLYKHNVGCTKCSGISGVDRIKDHETFLIAAMKRCPDLEFLSEYNGRHNSIKCKCKLCGKEFNQKPDMILRLRNGKLFNHCPRCSKSPNGRTMEDFKFMLNKINKNISISGEYINCKTHVSCHCEVCGCEWKATPDNLLHGFGCPDCANKMVGLKRRNSNDDFLYALKNRNASYANGMFEIIGEYNTYHGKVKCFCNIHNIEYEASTAYLLRSGAHDGKSSTSCPMCSSSHGENAIYLYLKENSIQHEREKEFNELIGDGGGNLRYDFYLPNNNLLIEYNGEQHYEDAWHNHFDNTGETFSRQLKHDAMKKDYAKEKHINMLTIGYWDYDNIDGILSNVLFGQPYFGALEFDRNETSIYSDKNTSMTQHIVRKCT